MVIPSCVTRYFQLLAINDRGQRKRKTTNRKERKIETKTDNKQIKTPTWGMIKREEGRCGTRKCRERKIICYRLCLRHCRGQIFINEHQLTQWRRVYCQSPNLFSGSVFKSRYLSDSVKEVLKQSPNYHREDVFINDHQSKVEGRKC